VKMLIENMPVIGLIPAQLILLQIGEEKKTKKNKRKPKTQNQNK